MRVCSDVDHLSTCYILFQDYIFYLEPEKLESGKGKCSYDPKVDTVSALISEFLWLCNVSLNTSENLETLLVSAEEITELQRKKASRSRPGTRSGQ